MRDYPIRVLLAAIMSLSCAAITFLWSRHYLNRASAKRNEPVAWIVKTENEVERRPADRLVWQRVLKSQELFSGEALRTASNGGARIEFLESKTVLELESDTAIEIEQSPGHVDLSFLKGNITIRNLQTASDEVRVKLGGEWLPIAGADLQLAKKEGAGMEVNLLAGSPTSLAPPLQTMLARSPSLQVLAPLTSDLLSSAPGEGDWVEFKFRPLPASYLVHIASGPTRNQLREAKDVEPVNGELGHLKMRLSMGRHYFQLVAQSREPHSASLLPVLESAIYRLDVAPRIAARPIEPARDVTVVMPAKASSNASVRPASKASTQQAELKFRWDNPGRLADLLLEVAQSPDLKQKKTTVHVQERLEGELAIPVTAPTKIYWRVSGRMRDRPLMVSSSIQSFTLAPAGFKVAEPKPTPESTPVAATPPTPVATAPPSPPAPAPVSWPAPSLITNENKAALLPQLKWQDGLTQVRTSFKTRHPELNIGWDRGPGDPVAWRLRVQPPSSSGSQPAAWENLAVAHLRRELEVAGKYQIDVESLDADGEVIARAATRVQEFVLVPPPAAPELLHVEKGASLEASERGELDLEWRAVPGAKSYVVAIFDDAAGATGAAKSEAKSATSGALPIQRETVTTTHLHLSHLKPGRGRVELRSVDALERPSPHPEERALQVPEYSDVEAPKLKNIKVK